MSISVGVVSALNRMHGRAIQTDANVSATNYGGPLVDLEGRVLGILVPMAPQAPGAGEANVTAGSEFYDSGIGFAVPLSHVLSVVDRWVESLTRKLPQTTRYAKQQLNVWRDLAWHQTVGHARDWLALSMLGDEAQGAVRAFLARGKEE